MEQNLLENLRQDYKRKSLGESDLSADPFTQFENWFNEAVSAGLYEPNAMNLATADVTGRPSARIVLLKGFDTSGFKFYSNYSSHKGSQLSANPYAALTFFWPELERQVRIEGKVEKTTAEESDAYFNKRPTGSQIGAIVSPQSSIIPDRNYLEERWKLYAEQAVNQVMQRPENWGGYKVVPSLVEFWQGRPGRLHDRLAYTLENQDGWKIARLAP